MKRLHALRDYDEIALVEEIKDVVRDDMAKSLAAFNTDQICVLSCDQLSVSVVGRQQDSCRDRGCAEQMRQGSRILPRADPPVALALHAHILKRAIPRRLRRYDYGAGEDAMRPRQQRSLAEVGFNGERRWLSSSSTSAPSFLRYGS